jgi:hypothetical protein
MHNREDVRAERRVGVAEADGGVEHAHKLLTDEKVTGRRLLLAGDFIDLLLKFVGEGAGPSNS